MAEFQEVVKQAARICHAFPRCERCPLDGCNAGCMLNGADNVEDIAKYAELIERRVMEWAKKNPEPIYPNWNVVWRMLFPDSHNAPCPGFFLNFEMVKQFCVLPRKCEICRSQPIPADIAEKLGVKPIGGASDE